MKTVIVAGVALLVGVALGYSLSLRTINRLRRMVRALRAGLDKPPKETMKRFVWACVINGFAWVWFSYILAALDKMQIAEELSKVALTEIIVPVVAYAFKSVVENLSKHNHWPDKRTADGTDSTAGPEPEREEPPDWGQ